MSLNLQESNVEVDPPPQLPRGVATHPNFWKNQDGNIGFDASLTRMKTRHDHLLFSVRLFKDD